MTFTGFIKSRCGQLLFLSLLTSSTPANATAQDSVVAKAINESGSKVSDSIDTKIALLLHLLNDSNYLYESSPDPIHKYSTFTSTSRSEAENLIKKYSVNSSGAPYAPYDLDSARSPLEMLRQRIGGTCGTHARVFALLLHRLGVQMDNLRIVSAVTDNDYRGICPHGKSSEMDSVYNGASGHVFVLIKMSRDDSWKLVNTTYSPFDEKNGPHVSIAEAARQLLHAHFATKKAEEDAEVQARKMIGTLRIADLDVVDFMSPQRIYEKFNHGEAVSVPKFVGLEEMGSLTIFEVVRPDEYLKHVWRDRFHLIASGSKSGTTCRFNLPGGG